MKRAPLAASLLALVSLAGCGSATAPAPPPATAAPYTVIVVQRLDAPEERPVEGRVEGVRQATVTAQTAGEVLEVVHDTGASVEAGAVVVRIKSTRQSSDVGRAMAAVTAARAQATEAEARYQRMKELVARNVVSRAAFDETTAHRDATAAHAAAAEAEWRAAQEGLAYTSARTPFAGVITDRYVQAGAVVSPGMSLYGIAATHDLRVTAVLPQDFAERLLKNGEVVVYSNDRRYALKNVVVHPRTGEMSGSFGLRADLPPEVSGLYPGSIVRLGLTTGRSGRLFVPTGALVHREEIDGAYVFDPSNGGRTSFRNLRLGHRDGDTVEVLAGLEAGERIAADPGAALQHLQSAGAK